MMMMMRWTAFVCCIVAGCFARDIPRPLARPSYYGQDLEHCDSKHDHSNGGGYQVRENAGLNNLYNDFAARLNSNIFNVQPTLVHPIATPQETADIIALYTNGVFKNGIPKIQTRRRRDTSEADFDEHVPVIGKDGVPLETPEVRRAREQHFLAHAMARARKDHYSHENVDEENHVAPIVQFKLEYPDEHIPLIGTNGVPLETDAVRHAKELHFAAHERARLRLLEEESKESRKERPAKEEKIARNRDEPKEYGRYSYNEDDEDDF